MVRYCWFIFVYNGCGYAVIKYYRVKELFSNILKNSSYYYLLNKPVNYLHFILQKKNHCELDIVFTDQMFESFYRYRENELFICNKYFMIQWTWLISWFLTCFVSFLLLLLILYYSLNCMYIVYLKFYIFRYIMIY